MRPDPARGPRGLRTALRLAGTLAIPVLCAGFLVGHVGDLDHNQLMDCLRALTPGQWGAALMATLVAFLAVSRQERAIHRHFGYRFDPRHATGAAMATAAVAQIIGFGPFVGAVVRARLLPEMSLKQSFLVSGGITVGFFTGSLLVALALHAVATGSIASGLVVVAVLALIASRAFWPTLRWRGLGLPSAATMLALIFWVAVDFLALALAFWALLPQGHGQEVMQVLAGFTLSLAIGLLSGSPAGTGPFESLLFLQLPGVEAEVLIAGLLAFRAVSYALPALIGAAWALTSRMLLPPAEPAPAEGATPGLTVFAPYDRAEVQLSHQAELELLRDRRGQLWTSTVVGGVRVLVGEPAVIAGRARWRSLEPVFDFCAHEQRNPLFYKIGQRQALAARKARYRVLRISAEAVIDPQAHTTEGPKHANLRRKLRHAAKAGVTVTELPARVLPPVALAEMDALAQDWARRHGGERGLTTGRWNKDYARKQRIFAAHDASGRMLAFATFHATAQEWVLDLMRFGEGTPDGTLYLIVHEAILAARALYVPRFSLAAVPAESFGLGGLLGRKLKPFSQKARGLHQFKSTFAPRWEPRYAAASNWLALLSGLALLAGGIHLAGRRPADSPAQSAISTTP